VRQLVANRVQFPQRKPHFVGQRIIARKSPDEPQFEAKSQGSTTFERSRIF
jgi:hypothetical protein